MEKEKIDYLLEFGVHVRSLRTKKGLSAAELARRSDFERSHINRIEAGNSNSTLFTLKKLAQGFDMTIEELFQGFDK